MYRIKSLGILLMAVLSLMRRLCRRGEHNVMSALFFNVWHRFSSFLNISFWSMNCDRQNPMYFMDGKNGICL